ncbi:MAG: hypothetical protein AAFR35_08285 [Pseudomonadota bacterium]
MSAASLLGLVEIYLWSGAAVAALFLTWGIDRIDPDARGAYVFRPILVPGVMLLWPIVLWRWWVLESGRDDWRRRHDPPRRAHQGAAVAMAVTIVLALVLGLANRQIWPVHIAPEQLSAVEADQ